MKLPIIKKINTFIEERDVDFVHETIETLEMISEIPTIKEQELDVIGELISNMYGAIEVRKAMTSGQSEKEALKHFMQRVMGSIDPN